MVEYAVMSPLSSWVDANGKPVPAFYRCIMGLFEILGTNTPGTLIPDNSVGNAKLTQGPAHSLKGNPTAAPANEQDLTLGAGLSFVGATLVSSSPFSKSFSSVGQVITAAGALVLVHGLGAMPFGVLLCLRCLVGEANYVAGDEVAVALGSLDTLAANRGVSVVPDITNLNIRFGSGANTFIVPDKTTGASTALTNANWTAVFKAWL